MPTITVEIDSEGGVQVAVQGCPGPSCKALTRDLEAALGETVKDTPTREMTQQVHLPLKRTVKR